MVSKRGTRFFDPFIEKRRSSSEPDTGGGTGRVPDPGEGKPGSTSLIRGDSGRF
jgi:hypothetical protein